MSFRVFTFVELLLEQKTGKGGHENKNLMSHFNSKQISDTW